MTASGTAFAGEASTLVRYDVRMSERTSDFPKTSQPAQNALQHAGIYTLTELATHSRKEIAALHGMGPKALGILEAALKERGLSFRER